MTRHNSYGYGHFCRYRSHFGGYYVIGWYVDRYYSGSRLRFPHKFERDTDEIGARKFCEKWNIKFPEAETVMKKAEGK